jgi:hypothetical protein
LVYQRYLRYQMIAVVFRGKIGTSPMMYSPQRYSFAMPTAQNIACNAIGSDASMPLVVSTTVAYLFPVHPRKR